PPSRHHPFRCRRRPVAGSARRRGRGDRQCADRTVPPIGADRRRLSKARRRARLSRGVCRCCRVKASACAKSLRCPFPHAARPTRRLGPRGGGRQRPCGRPARGDDPVTTPWLTVIGIGEDGRGGLSAVARRLLDEAEIVFGAARHFDLAGPLSAETVAWPSPLPAGIEARAARRGRPTVALTTGDPMWFGLGATLARRFPAEEMLVLPAPSAFSLAAARLGWPLQDVDCLSLHGRPVDLL